MIRYYVYQEHDYDISKSIKSISDLYETQDVISLPEKSYLLRVPFIQRYEGVGLVLSSSVILNEKINLDDLDFQNKLGIVNSQHTIFIVNFGHDYAKETLCKTNMVVSPMRNIDVERVSWHIDDGLNNMLLKQEKPDTVFLGQGKDENIVGE